MAKTSSFRALSRALQRALFLQRHPELKNALEDYHGALREKSFSSDRRQFLKASLALGITASPFMSLACSAMPRVMESNQEPVVVLGGGLGGLTAAYRLTQAGRRCTVYEAQSRLGGRIQTKKN